MSGLEWIVRRLATIVYNANWASKEEIVNSLKSIIDEYNETNGTNITY